MQLSWYLFVCMHAICVCSVFFWLYLSLFLQVCKKAVVIAELVTKTHKTQHPVTKSHKNPPKPNKPHKNHHKKPRELVRCGDVGCGWWLRPRKRGRDCHINPLNQLTNRPKSVFLDIFDFGV